MNERVKWQRWDQNIKRAAIEQVLAGAKPSAVAEQHGCSLVSLYEWLRADGCISRHATEWIRP